MALVHELAAVMRNVGYEATGACGPNPLPDIGTPPESLPPATEPRAQNARTVLLSAGAPDPEAVRFLVGERDVFGCGTETIGTDAGQAQHLHPPYPCHYYLHGAGRHGLQCLASLDLLPPTGAVVICPPLRIRQGSGSPLRVLALVPGSAAHARA